jgi:hypothetical protein
VKTETVPGSWFESGGSAQIYLDPPSNCLLVLQSQPIQQAVERLLAKP